MIKKLSFFDKKNFMFYLISLILILLVFYYGAITDYKDIVNFSSNKELGLSIFYTTLTTGNYIYTTIICLTILPNLYITKAISNKVSKLDNLIIYRIGARKYLSNIYFFNFLISLSFYFVSLISILILIHLKLSEISLSFDYVYISSISPGFSNNVLIDLICYVTLSCLGYATFSSFLFGICYFLKSKYLVRSIGIIIGVIFLLAAAVIGQALSSYFDVSLLIYITAPFYVPYIITPGLECLAGAFNYSSPFVFYFWSLFGIIIFSRLLFIIAYKDMKTYG